MSQQQTLLDQDGLRIDLTNLTSGGKSLKWRDLGIVRSVRQGSLLQKVFPGLGNYAITFATCTNQILPGSQQIAWLVVEAATNQPSAFVRVAIGPITGSQPDGRQLSSYLQQAARVVVVGEEPLVEAGPAGNGYIQLTLYALPGTTNQLQTAETLPPQGWLSGQQVIPTNLTTTLPPQPATNRMLFFRARRQ
jgi:hypothetical protein